ncbi:unnamed protein product, partial [Mesorhabditis belari]|uniref:26S proteasome non-ATPase regulatory subunit 13 n=1 Tax=Mesorhabditis belari TaxID=2138241 RepID=A0AAF3EEV1_9BILA
MALEKVEAFLAKQKNSAQGEVADKWQKLEQLYTKKLWHQLTKEVLTLLSDETFSRRLNLKEFYDNFVSEFEHRINCLHLVEICIPVARFLFTTDKPEAFNFLEKIEKTVAKDKQATIRLHTAQIELRLNNKDQNECCLDIQKVRGMLESTQKEIDDLVGVTEVHAPFYKMSAVYLKEIGDFAGYYREALRYLGVEDANKLSFQDKHYQAVLIGFAALLGENIYNFGELLAHPILKSLDGSQEKWLLDVLYAFNEGDLNKFYGLERYWGGWPDMKKQKEFLVEKIRLLSIMEIALARPSKERNISFGEIATKAQIETSKVEHLVMKALSKELIRGAIDQVNQTVHISWVQPRVLNATQILSMADRISEWCRDVAKMENIVNDNAKEIILTKS